MELLYAPLGRRRGLWIREGGHDTIVLDPALSRRERRCVLAHELVHVERGVGAGAASAATMEREEAIVRREVSRRLVPPRALAVLVAGRSTVGPVTAADVAEAFDVEEAVAALALEDLRRRAGA